MNNGSERQNKDVALNAKWEMNYGSEHQIEKRRWLCTLKLKARLWTPKLKTNDGFERQTENVSDGSECRTGNKQRLWTPNGKWMMALNAKLRNDDGSERQNETMVVSQTKLNNHERQAENDDSERRN